MVGVGLGLGLVILVGLVGLLLAVDMVLGTRVGVGIGGGVVVVVIGTTIVVSHGGEWKGVI